MPTKDLIENIAVPPSCQKRIKGIDIGDIKLSAEAIVAKYPIKTMRETKSMWLYDIEKGFYIPNAETYIQSNCVRNPGYNSRSVFEELLFNIRGMTYIDSKDFESASKFINLKNGVYDIEKGELTKFDPKYYFRYSLDITYDKNATCNIFEDMIMKMTKFPEDYDLIQRWFGYHFYKSRLEKRALFVVGPPDTGKTTLLWVLQQLIGEDNFSAHSLRDLSGNKYAVADLYNKLANINADASTMMPKDISIFKLLTGGDSVPAREIFQKPFKFRNQSKLTFAFNYLPNVKEPILSDTAFWNRIMIIVVQKCYIQEDKSIREKLMTELPGILNWAIKGYKDFCEKGFSYYKINKETKELWIKYMEMCDDSNSNSSNIPETEIIKIPPNVFKKY